MMRAMKIMSGSGSVKAVSLFTGVRGSITYWELKWKIRYYSMESYRLSYIPKYHVTRVFYNVHEI